MRACNIYFISYCCFKEKNSTGVRNRISTFRPNYCLIQNNEINIIKMFRTFVVDVLQNHIGSYALVNLVSIVYFPRAEPRTKVL